MAVDNLPEILKVDGFDGCFVGHGDMSLVMGREYYGGPTVHPDVQALVDRAIDLTLEAGRLVMFVAPTGAEAAALARRGVQLITMNFGALVRRACEAYFAEYRAARGTS